MSLNIGNRARQTTSTTGTGTYSLSLGAYSSKYRTLVDAVSAAMGGSSPWANVPYIVSDDTDYEIGLGTLTDSSPDTLSRDTVIESSNADAAVDWGAGTKDVYIGMNAQQIHASFMIHGQCRLDYTNATTITLTGFNGQFVMVKTAGGAWLSSVIPSAGITLANTGLAASTIYYIYLYNNAGALTLEASTTAPAVDTDTGVQIKTGDATRTLVGAVRTEGSTPGQFVDSVKQRFTLSYFNRRDVHLIGVRSPALNTASTTYVELDSTNCRLEFLTWGDEAVEADAAASGVNNTNANEATYLSIQQSATTGASANAAQLLALHTDTGDGTSITVKFRALLSAGYYYLTAVGKVSAGTGQLARGETNSLSIFAKIRG